LKADTVNLGLNTTKAIFPETFFATDDDRMAREEYTLYAATYLATLQKVNLIQIAKFPATRNAIFRCGTGCREGVLRAQFRPNLSRNVVALQVAEKNCLV